MFTSQLQDHKRVKHRSEHNSATDKPISFDSHILQVALVAIYLNYAYKLFLYERKNGPIRTALTDTVNRQWLLIRINLW